MGLFWNYGLLTLAVLAGAAAVFMAFQLQKRFRGFTTSYAYYILLLYIFGAYSLAGSALLEELLLSLGAEHRLVDSARDYLVLPGIPLLALAHYMYIRSFRDYFQKPLKSSTTLIYFLLLLFAFGSYMFFLLRLNRFEQGQEDVVRQMQLIILGLFFLPVYPWCLFDVLRYSRKLDRGRKMQLRFISFSYLAYGLLVLSGFLLRDLHPLVPRLLLLLMLSWHILPMFFLNILLEKNRKLEKLEKDDFPSRLADFVAKHEISKRESEVVRLICAGMSNQEISESLFITLQTVKDHIHRIFVKTGVKNRVQLTNMIR